MLLLLTEVKEFPIEIMFALLFLFVIVFISEPISEGMNKFFDKLFDITGLTKLCNKFDSWLDKKFNKDDKE